MSSKIKINDSVLVKGTVCEKFPGGCSVRFNNRGKVSFPLNEVFPSIPEKTYEDGQLDMWEKIKKVVLSLELGGYTEKELEEIFGEKNLTITEILEDYSLNEFISLINNYEKEKEKKLRVGEEIKLNTGETYWVIALTENYFYGYFSGEGEPGPSPIVFFEKRRTIFKKTGRTTDMIELIKGEKIK